MFAGAPAGSSAATGSNRRIQQIQNHVDEAEDIMRVNVDKVLERDQKLSKLDDCADDCRQELLNLRQVLPS
ncbi:Vesicle-associated membrane protein 3 [Sciurus carolinensis]|uniref:Vesicle-associated membrane protein 3 n=1 Tax=Sciurus carolinensis TaxID=30640 RepID=A0AA41NDM4_SCICA|nr:Vesicle-associated membrane protein 3 [Sciurus carolinensis]